MRRGRLAPQFDRVGDRDALGVGEGGGVAERPLGARPLGYQGTHLCLPVEVRLHPAWRVNTANVLSLDFPNCESGLKVGIRAHPVGGTRRLVTVSRVSDEKPSLSGPRVKLDRASAHFEAFATAWQQVVDRDDFTFVHEVHANGVNHRYRAAAVPELDVRWALILGDCVHNLRAALDHLAYELVRVDGGTPGERTQFPVQYVEGPAFVWGGVSDEARGAI